LENPPPAGFFGDSAGAALSVALSAAFSAGFAASFAPASVTLAASAALASTAADLSSFGASASGRSARFFLLSWPPLKSVSYQPPPFRRNTGADINRVSCGLPHSGHFFKGESLTFCMASKVWPQLLH
jgi:hypothetical protein